MAENAYDSSRRESTRFRTVYAGKIRYRGKFYKCTVHDVSSSGAKLKPRDDLPDTKTLELIIDRLGPYRPMKSEVAWRTKDWWGLRFVGDQDELKKMVAELLPSRWSLMNK